MLARRREWMPCSRAAEAKRALVRLLLSLATAHRVLVRIKRDSADKDALAAYRRVALKVHPDKGGASERREKGYSKVGGGRLAQENGAAGCKQPRQAELFLRLTQPVYKLA